MTPLSASRAFPASVRPSSSRRPAPPRAVPERRGGTRGFAQLLSQKLGGVVDLQNEADAASQAVATGQSSDLAGATVAVEKASIAIDLVSSIRNKAVDAYQDVMRMQV